MLKKLKAPEYPELFYYIMIGKWKEREEAMEKMDIKLLLKLFYKNRLLIALCSVLIAGTLFGNYVLKLVPDNIGENLFLLLSQNSENFGTAFLNNFCFPFVLLFCIFLSGFSIIGTALSFVTVFLSGCFYGFENALNYSFLGEEFIFPAVVLYLTFTFCFDFLLIIMAENTFFASADIRNIIIDKKVEKTHYNAKKQTVKFITFTLIVAFFSAFSSYFYPLIVA